MAVISALVVGMTAVAVAQSNQQIPAVEVHPVGTTRDDPNAGQWFVTNLDPGQSKQLQVRLYNPASVAQTVKLYLGDIAFDQQGVPGVTNNPIDVGRWGSFDQPKVTVPPLQSVIEAFSITAPKGADPGDHIGAVIAEQAPEGTGLIRSIKRLAVRLYVTLPGDARKEFEIAKVSVAKDSSFYTHKLTVGVQLRNTGRVRLEPTVQVDNVAAKGAALLLTRSVERYVVTRPVHFWGGPVRLRIDAQTRSLGLPGPQRQLYVTTWVIPWQLLALLALIAGLAFLVRLALRRRGSKMQSLQADLHRIERLVTQNGGSAPVNGFGQLDDANAAIRAALKQARRAGDDQTAESLKRILEDKVAVLRRNR